MAARTVVARGRVGCGPPSGARVHGASGSAASRTRRGRLATGEGPTRPSEWARRVRRVGPSSRPRWVRVAPVSARVAFRRPPSRPNKVPTPPQTAPTGPRAQGDSPTFLGHSARVLRADSGAGVAESAPRCGESRCRLSAPVGGGCRPDHPGDSFAAEDWCAEPRVSPATERHSGSPRARRGTRLGLPARSW